MTVTSCEHNPSIFGDKSKKGIIVEEEWNITNGGVY